MSAALRSKEFVLAGFFSSVGLWPNMEVTNEMKAKLWETMELLEIPHLLNRNLTEISTGEQRRVLLARALVHDPKALLLDEPSSSLDMRAASELRKILRKIAPNGVSIILVTHDLTDIIPEIKRVILLKEGRIFGDGTKEEVLTSETISDLFGAPFEVVGRRLLLPLVKQSRRFIGCRRTCFGIRKLFGDALEMRDVVKGN